MIGEEVRRRREERGLTGAQLAARAGLAPSAVSQIETGKRIPSSTSVMKLAHALGIEAGELFPKAQSPLPLPEPPQGASPEEAAREFERNWIEMARAESLGPNLLDRAQDAARQDAEKDVRAVARLSESEGVPQSTTGYQEDAFRAELRALGFPDEHFEEFIWPLVVKAVRADRLDRELVELKGEVAELRSRLAEAKVL